MSFSSKVKAEIIKRGVGLQKDAKKAFLAGFIRATGAIIKVGEEFGFQYYAESQELATLLTDIFFELYGFTVECAVTERDNLNNRQKQTFEVLGKRALETLIDLEILSGGKSLRLNQSDLGGVLVNETAKKAFIKGVFVGSGSLTVPKKTAEKKKATGYHLELTFTSEEASINFVEILNGFGIYPKITFRRFFVVYLKSSEDIKDFLALLGANKAVIEITELMVEKEVMNNVNRQKNCDLANVNKQLLAAEKQIKAIEILEKNGRFDALGKDLKETAIVRKENPEVTLLELADMLGVTKSCVNHRLRKIVQIANEK